MSEVLRLFNYRQLFWKWHLYAGWFGGPLLILIAVTGAILVFGPELDSTLRSDLWRITPPSPAASQAFVSDQSMIDTLRRTYPDESIVIYRQSEAADQPYQFALTGKRRRGGVRDVWINPYTGSIVGERMREMSLVRIAEQLHRRLLTGETGSTIIELITGWGIILSLTGVFLWWPKTLKTLKHGLTLSFQGSAYKVNWRLHNTLGAWTAVFILLMCVTGMVFSTYAGGTYKALMDRTGASANIIYKPPKSTLVKDAKPVPIDPLLNLVRRELPPGTPLNVRMPNGPAASYVITTVSEHRPEWRNRAAFKAWAFDQFSGAEIQRGGWHDFHLLMKLVTISKAIHYGSIFGLPTKIIAFVSCLVMPVLSVTGYLIWWWKRKKRQPGSTKLATAKVPHIETRPISKWLVASLLIVGVIFPLIGASFVALMLWELLSFFARKLFSMTTSAPVLNQQVSNAVPDTSDVGVS